MVDGRYRLIHVGRKSITLKNGAKTYEIPLGTVSEPATDTAAKGETETLPRGQPALPANIGALLKKLGSQSANPLAGQPAGAGENQPVKPEGNDTDSN
jgi:hypothetical protein